MTVRTYRSTNAGTPVQSGSIGAFLPVLDMLVNGSTPQAITSITQTGGTATVTTPGLHGLTTSQMILHQGAAEPDYNIEAPITVTGLYSYTFPINPAAPAAASGTLQWKIAGSGWTKPYTATNKAAYKQPTGTRERFIAIDDTGTTTARLKGFETMSDAITGTGQFPTEGQQAGGLYYHKSNAASTAARKYVMICNGPNVFIYSNVDDAPAANTGACLYAFGTLASFKPGDLYDNFIIAGNGAAPSVFMESVSPSAINTAVAGHYLCRSYTQLGSAVTAGKTTDAAKMLGGGIMGNTGIAYPSPVDGGLYMAPVFMHENALSAIRGTIPGIFAPMHIRPIASFDTFDGTGAQAGKRFEAFSLQTQGQVMLEMSNTW